MDPVSSNVKKNKVLLAMSGGTDSSVAALLLKDLNCEIEGMTFRSYDSISKACMEKESGCCNADSLFEAKKLAESLGFNHQIIDVRDVFDKTVIENFVNGYLSGLTPNPCVVCNKTIKWGKMLEEADKLNCRYLATGHYAQVVFENGRYFLRQGVDKTKDQTYFLWTLTQENLARTIFPLGLLTKTEVREIARKNNYEKLASKRESQEICFIPDDDYRSFLRERVSDIDNKIGHGDFIDTTGKIIGKHKGYPFYTIGQRKGLEIAMGYPVYVLKIDADNNIITLGTRDELLSNELVITNINLMKYAKIPDNMEAVCKIRYNNQGESCIINQKDDKIYIRFKNLVSAITPGQSAVIYEGDDVVAGGIIVKIS